MSNPATKRAGANAALSAALACTLAGIVLFQFFGNAAHGYVKTESLFWWWISQWLDPAAETQHGWLILALSGWLFWRNLGAGSPESRVQRSQSGLSTSDSRLPASGAVPCAAMIAGLALHALGFAVQQARISIVALLLFSWGVIALAGRSEAESGKSDGMRWGRAAVFPIGFMLFAIPFNALDSVGFWLRMAVIDVSSAIAHGAGIRVLQNGTQLVAPDGRYQYDVAAACSGVRSLMALLSLSLLVGYLNLGRWWLRAAVLVLCIPLVYVGNVARISSIVFAAQWGGQAWGERAHTVMGYGIFAMVFGGVMAGVAALRRFDGARRSEAGSQGSEVGAGKSEVRCQKSDVRERPAVRATAAAIVILAVGDMALIAHLRGLAPLGSAGVRLAADAVNPVDLPAFLGTEWIGKSTEVTAVEREILPPDTGFSRRIYVPVADLSQAVLLSIVLSGRDRTSIHRPELCLVGQGWTIDGVSRQRFSYPGHPSSSFPATVLRVHKTAGAGTGGIANQLVTYWFVSSDSVVATNWQRFLHDAWNRVGHLRVDRWAYVLMQTDARDGEAVAIARLQAVLDRTLPAFQPPL